MEPPVAGRGGEGPSRVAWGLYSHSLIIFPREWSPEPRGRVGFVVKVEGTKRDARWRLDCRSSSFGFSNVISAEANEKEAQVIKG